MVWWITNVTDKIKPIIIIVSNFHNHPFAVYVQLLWRRRTISAIQQRKPCLVAHMQACYKSYLENLCPWFPRSMVALTLPGWTVPQGAGVVSDDANTPFDSTHQLPTFQRPTSIPADQSGACPTLEDPLAGPAVLVRVCDTNSKLLFCCTCMWLLSIRYANAHDIVYFS